MRREGVRVTLSVVAKAPQTDEEDTRFDARWALVFATIVIVLVKMLVPFGDEMLYPFTLMATWVHEMGHGLTALAVGGSFDSLDVFWNGSGLAHCRYPGDWRGGLVSMGGLLAPPIVGASMLAFARGPKRSTVALFALAGAMLLSVPIWVRSVTGFVVIPLVAAALGLLAYKGGPGLKHIGAQAIGLLLGLDTVTGLDYLFTSEAFVDGELRASDIANVGERIGGPWILWGVALAVLSLALVAAGLRVAWMEELKIPKLRRRR